MKITDVDALILQEIQGDSLIFAVMSSPLDGDKGPGDKCVVRPILLQEQRHFQVTSFKDCQARHRNLTPKEASQELPAMARAYKQTQLFTVGADYHLLRNRKGVTCVRNAPSKKPISHSHNQSKQHVLPEGTPNPFLHGLGLMNPAGKVIASKAHKFRQINRFLELILHTIGHQKPNKPLHIVDLGCGKAYLTFALYHYLKDVAGWEVSLMGVDRKADVIGDCRTLAQQLGYTNLQFYEGDIAAFESHCPVDIVVSLHACNIATDIALAKAVSWKATHIFAAPCCQQELYSQVRNDGLQSLLRHGILKERVASLITDAARAELLEAAGYETQVVEFIEMEHSPKNLMLRSTLAPSSGRQEQARQRYLKMQSAMNISPSLEELIKKSST